MSDKMESQNHFYRYYVEKKLHTQLGETGDTYLGHADIKDTFIFPAKN